MYAVRNISLCTKDCLCLYVCPTGASDTENGKIDTKKCIGCGKCALACPSHAIVIIPRAYPEQQPKTKDIVESMRGLARSKAKQEQIAEEIAQSAETPVEKQFAKAIAKSNRIMGEDIIREAGYMLPQSNEVNLFLESLLAEPQTEDFPSELVEELLRLLPDR